MTEWKPTEQNIKQPVTGYCVSPPYPIPVPKYSNWTCYLFGATPGNGIQWTPEEGKVPNRFVRFMMRICFDCKWVEKK